MPEKRNALGGLVVDKPGGYEPVFPVGLGAPGERLCRRLPNTDCHLSASQCMMCPWYNAYYFTVYTGPWVEWAKERV